LEGRAVEALARYLHAHADLRSFLDQQRRSKEPMAWVNLACQHLPITGTARQKLLDLIHALLRKVEVQLQPIVRFLGFADLIGFIGGKKIALRPGGRREGRGQRNAQ
jgi:hypothetical protein